MTGSAWNVLWEGDPSPDYLRGGATPLQRRRIRHRSYCGVFCFSVSAFVI